MNKAERDSRNVTGLIRAYGGSVHAVTRDHIPTVSEPGVYLLYFVTSASLQTCFPVYCGFTSRPLKTRLGEHLKPGGAIYTMRTPGGIENTSGLPISTADGDVYVGFIPGTGMLAKLVESCFLVNYDFVLNTGENTQRRPLDMSGIQESTWAALDDTGVAREQIEHWNDTVEHTLNEAVADAKTLIRDLKHFRGLD